MAKIYYNGDINEAVLQGKTVAIIGYGSQGHAHALNLKTADLMLLLVYVQGKSFDQAKEDGLDVYTVEKLLKKQT